jgi:hypothetical protein
VIGAALGLGVISNPSCDECDGKGGLALALRLGGMITPDMAILADLSGIFHGEKDDGVRQSLTHGLLAAALKWWVFDKAWIQGGLGAGRANETVQFNGAAEVQVERSGYGLLLGAGIEFLQAGSFVLDVQLRFVAVEYDGEPTPLTNTSIDLGFNWY